MSDSRARTNKTSTRRDFLRHTAAATISTGLAAGIARNVSAQAAGANDRLGVGFIGTGGRGGAHLGAIKWLKEHDAGVEIVAVCDTYRPRMQHAADNFKVKGYMDHRELLADPNVDMVCVATPDHSHGFQALDAVRAGKHVYCEKPVTHWRQFELTKELAVAVRESNSVFQLGAQGMSDGAWRLMKKLIQDGLIGQPIHAECGYFRVGDWGERGMPIDDPNVQPGPDLDWDAFLGDSPKRDFDVSRYFRWRMYEDYAGGPCTDLFPHSLCPVVDMLGVTMPALAVGTGGKFRYDEREVPDTFNMLIDYPEKITIAVLGTQANNYSATGDRGAGGKVPVVRGWDGSLTVEGNEVVFIPAEGSKKEAQRFPIEHGEDLVEHFRNWVECSRKGDKNTNCPMDLAYHVQTALQMGFLGYRAGKTARFDAEKEAIVV